MGKMSKVLEKAYIVVFAVLGILALFYVFTYRAEVTRVMGRDGYVITQIEDVSEEAFDENKKLRVHIGDVTDDNCHLVFYTIHKSVTVFSGPVRIYGMTSAKNNAISKTPGCVWNDILLTKDMSNTDLIVNLIPAYKGLSFQPPTFYLGDKASIIAEVISDQLPAFIVSIILVVLGIIMVSYIFYNRKNTEVDKSLYWLGIFTFYVGIWKIFDSSVAKLIFQGLPVVSMIPFMAMSLVSIPFLIYFSDMFSSKDSKIWMITCGCSVGVDYLCLFFQYFNIFDFRQMLPWILLSILVAAAVSIYMVIKEYRYNRWSMKLRRNLACMIMLLIGFLVDLSLYIVTGGRNAPGVVVFGFMLFIIVQGLFAFKESGALIVAGDGVQKMEDYAFHDKLTGLYNRAAFITDTDPYAVNPDSYAVAVMDLNDLKKCNDTLGHDVGDRYIKDSAKIIQETFGCIGNCYRMGGDEFYCLIPKGGKKACREQEIRMEEMIREYNETSEQLKISIACGFARFDQRMDYDLNATAKRADKAMYKRKEEMKAQQRAKMND